MNDEEVGVFRSCVGSLIYVSMDREDLAYATKELAKRLKTPTRGDHTDLMRTAKFLWFTKDYIVVNSMDRTKAEQIVVQHEADWGELQG